jgi:toxin ParE1/3/4
MTKRIVQRPLAEQDIVNQALHIYRDNPAAARRFLAAVDQALAMLLNLPGIGAPRHHGKIEGLRMGRVRGFGKYLIFYREIADGIEVIRVLHSSRDIAAVLDEEPGE